jgi:hypothetical protein
MRACSSIVVMIANPGSGGRTALRWRREPHDARVAPGIRLNWRDNQLRVETALNLAASHGLLARSGEPSRPPTQGFAPITTTELRITGLRVTESTRPTATPRVAPANRQPTHS